MNWGFPAEQIIPDFTADCHIRDILSASCVTPRYKFKIKSPLASNKFRIRNFKRSLMPKPNLKRI
jgi:hypothetical protein